MLTALLLGVVQGLTEFIPVSSSGHLALGGALLGAAQRGLAFDVALHVGTLAAVVVVFRHDLFGMALALIGRDRDSGLRRLAGLLVVGTLPIVLAGPLARGPVEQLAASPRAAATFLFATAALLLAGEAWRSRRVRQTTRVSTGAGVHRDTPRRAAWGTGAGADASDPSGRPLGGITAPGAGFVGTVQCLALLPGISRSGATIAAGMAAGLTREAATRFSFLLSLPALVGAAVLTLPDLAGTDAPPLADVAVGALAAFLAGWAAIRFLLALVARVGLHAFAAYCIVIATLGLVLLG